MPTLGLHSSVQPQTTTVVAPQVVAQSALLELSFPELEARINEELEANPALELAETAPVTSFLWLPAEGAAVGEAPPALEDIARAPYTLRDELWWQFRAAAPPRLHPVGERLIGSVDEAGYLRADLLEIAEQLGVSPEVVLEGIERLQSLEPAGVGARNLAECLLLQVKQHRAEGSPVPAGAEQVLAVCSGRPRADLVGQMAAASGCRRAQVRQVLEWARRCLAPYPGWGPFAPERQVAESSGARHPEALIHRRGDDFRVEVPVSRGRYLRLNQAYLQLERAQNDLQLSAGAEAERKAREQLTKARGFLSLLKRREQIIRRLTVALVECQRPFLLHGPQRHQPLSKKQVAALTGLHESTVCRATRAKCVQLPSGEVVGYEVFFAAAVPIKRLIADLVHKEPADRPLSDEQIARLLTRAGHSVARRTVAKYRQAVGIPGSAQRRRRLA